MRTAHSKPEPKSSGTPYDGQRLRKNRIRLLTIHSSGDIIELRTQRYRLSRDIDYDAISYVWGAAPASVTAMCNNKRLLITPTVRKMLQYLYRYQAKTAMRKIWIDAICINQVDEEEKRTQIPLMRDIYSRAASVVVWMGPSTLETDVFFVEFQDVRKRSQDWIEHRAADPNHRNPVEAELPCDIYAFFEGLSHLLNNEWFRRLWTYQEIMLPPKATLLCGDSWTDFGEFVDFIVKGVYRTDYIILEWTSKTYAKNYLATLTCHAINYQRANASHRKLFDVIRSKSVAVNLYQLRYRHVKEPVDRVWAIAGLLESNPRHSLTSEVDYSEQGRVEYWKTWIVFAKALINEPGGISLLAVPPTLEPRPSYLPSWCPNLSGTNSCRMMIAGRWNLATVELPAYARWSLFEENSEAKCDERTDAIYYHDKGFVSTVKHDNLLRMRGFVLDTIEEVVEHEEILDMGYSHYDEDTEEYMALYDLAVGHHMDCLDLARRVFYGKSDGVTDVPEDFIMALFMDCRTTDRAKDLYHEIMPKLATWYSKPGFRAAREQLLCQHQLTELRGHTFFSTIGGRIGYAHPGCKPGDQVATFYGGLPLYILRQLIPTKDAIGSTGQAYGHVQYMGAAFIPHLMEQHQRDAARMGPAIIFIIH